MLGVCIKYTQHNYGSKLQALATVKAFERLGLEYEIIRYNKKTLSFYLRAILGMFNSVFLTDRYYEAQRKIEFRRHKEIQEKVNLRNNCFDRFDNCFEEHLSEIYVNYEELKNLCQEKYDEVISCSDQLWSPAALASGFYNLMFVPDNVKKVSWASSFGVSKIPKAQIRKTKKYLSRINYISMRENQGAKIVKTLTGRDVPVLMDPVFAFDKDEWAQFVPHQKKYSEPYIFCYFLGDNQNHRKQANIVAKRMGYKIVTLRHLDKYVQEDESFGDYAPYDVSPNDFLNLIRNAEVVLTDSFHGTAFSIIEGKQFVVFDRYSASSLNSKNSRIDSLCQNVGLQNRRYTDADSNIIEILREKIDFMEVHKKVSRYREKTWEYLKVLK